jgi:hypothetical protein
MSRWMQRLGLGCMLLGALAPVALAQTAGAAAEQKNAGSSTAVSRPQGLGQLLIRDAQSGSMRRLDVARYHVHVVLQPPVALVQIDQAFFNPFSRQEEGTFVFNLPRGASVSRFAMYVTPDKLVEGELIERERAVNVYESIVNRRRDPALLEQIGDNLFRMRVFPIPAQDVKRILLDYTIPLEPERDEYQFQLPLWSDLNPIGDFRLTGMIKGPTRPDSVASLSHPRLKVELPDKTRKDRIAFTLEARNYRPESDFSLKFVQPSGKQPQFRSYQAAALPPASARRPDPNGSWANRAATYFLASIPPRSAYKYDTGPTDVLILADTSEGMRHNRLLPEMLRTIIGHLRPCDRFQLACVDVGLRPLTDKWLVPEPAGNQAVLARFDKEYCFGGTDLVASFREAVRRFDSKGPKRRRVCLYLGDGEDTLTMTTATDLEKTLVDVFQKAGIPLCAAVVRETAKGTPLLESLTWQSGGQLFQVTMPSGQRELLRWLANLVQPTKILSVEAPGVAGEDLFYAKTWPAGQPLYVYGRAPATERVELRVTVDHHGQPKTERWEFDCRDEDDDVFVGRLWAQKKLDQLRLRAAGTKTPNEVQQAIVALSREWSLLSPYTAFLVLESEADYDRWGIVRQLRRRYWRPAEAMPKAPLPADWVVLNKPKPAGEHGRRKKVEAKQYAELIASARAALAANDRRLAHAFLERIKNHPLANSSDYADLEREVDLMSQRREQLAKQLGLHRSLLDPAYGGSKRIRIEPSLNLFVLGESRGSQAFVRRHPHYQALLQTISLAPPGEITVQRLCDKLRWLTGANVMLDLQALDDVGLDADTSIEFQGWGKMSLRNYTRFLLKSLDLVLVEEPHRLLITIPEEAETLLTTEVYPLADLYSAAGPRDLGLLSNPYLDHDEAAERRLQGKLQRPGSFDFREKPLGEALREIAEALDDTIVVDQRAIDDVGVSLENPVTISLDRVPLKEALAWILEQQELTYYLSGEAIVISTPEEAESQPITKLHSLRGIACNWHSEFFNLESSHLQRSLQNRVWFGGMDGMAGMDARSAVGGLGAGSFGGGVGDIGWLPRQAGISSVDTQEAGDLAPATSSEAAIASASEGTSTAPNTRDFDDLIDLNEERLHQSLVQQPSAPDFDSSIELITSMIQPTSWDEVGGPGSIVGFAPTLDLVVSATMEVHDEIEKQLRQLRELPVVDHDQMGVRLASPPTTEADIVFDPDGLVALITSIVAPITWAEIGGSANILIDEPRMALIVSQTADVHDELAQLLCRLRRSRFEILYGSRPWESGSSTVPVFDSLGVAGPGAELRLAKLPEPNASELAALAVRRQPVGGQWTWRYCPTGSTQPQRITLRTDGPRLELETDDAVVRLEDDQVDVAHPRLALVAHSNGAEALRQMADAWLPWLPHRSNEQLARLFVVQTVKTSSDQEPHRLRFIPNRQPETAGTYLEVAFARDSGQTLGWESYLNGKRTGRLRLDDRAASPGVWRTAILEDATGKTLARWELVEASEESSPIPELTHGWDGYVQLDRRTPEAAVDPAFRRALEAVQKAEWSRAMDEIRRANQVHPRHPLLQFLSAWCIHHDPNFGNRADVIRLLKQVATSRATLLTRFVGMYFQWLTPEERYDLLRQMPRDARRPLDWDQLAQAAMEAHQWEEALAATEIMLAAEPTWEHHRRHVELLLRLGRSDAAVTVARQWAAGEGVTPHQCATMAELFARHGGHACANELFDRALAHDISRYERYALLRRRANLLKGLPRWRLLLEAAALQPADSPDRGACIGTVLSELDFPQFEIAGQLADASPSPDLRAALRLRQAELAPDDATTAELLWQARSSDWFSPAHFHFACRLWNNQHQPDRVVHLAEAHLRAGSALSETICVELARAYRQLGRPRDARRAETADALPQER